MFSHTYQDGKLSVFFNQMKILEHTSEHPVLMLQRNQATIDMYRGNYFIEENVEETLGLRLCTINEAYVEGRECVSSTFPVRCITLPVSSANRMGA
jgi:alpha-glucosidase